MTDKNQEPQEPLRKAAVVGVVGRTNAGKSTIVNRLVGEKVSIVSPVEQTTRNTIRGIVEDPRGQLVLLDTPGLHKAVGPLGKLLNGMARASARDAGNSDRMGSEKTEFYEAVRSAFLFSNTCIVFCPWLMTGSLNKSSDGSVNDSISASGHKGSSCMQDVNPIQIHRVVIIPRSVFICAIYLFIVSM